MEYNFDYQDDLENEFPEDEVAGEGTEEEGGEEKKEGELEEEDGDEDEFSEE